ncbi:MAG TPA: MerR family transcriptional regulator [Anaerolineales bacterium]|nr:MerR family transcriptional regulator [Anaerolineales bacterium]
MVTETHFTVKQLADVAGVSARTLHYYDEIGLLKPARDPGNGYRIYAYPALLRLQQILFLRELGFSLDDIQTILDQPGFDLLPALEQHRQTLKERQERLEHLLLTVERTILHLRGSIEMESKELFEGFSAEKQKEYEEEIRQRYGEENLRVSRQRWGSYSEEKKRQIMEEGGVNYQALVAAMPYGPASPQAQEGVVRWHQHLRYFYEPTTEVLLGLGDLYNEDPRFAAFFQRIHPDLADFMRQAIQIYCQGK